MLYHFSNTIIVVKEDVTEGCSLCSLAHNDRVLLSGREFGKLLLSNAGQALLAAILLLAAAN